MLSNELLINFLIEAGIDCSSNKIDGLQIPRSVLIDDTRYEAVEAFIPELKICYSSSKLTSLQASAKDCQRWPLINIVRQVLKSSNYRLEPKRISDGYSGEGKKKYKRIFEIQKQSNSS